MDYLPINLDDLLNRRSVESIRVEYKATWDRNIRDSVCRTVCAFANDLLNLNGGYIILGVEESDGKPVFPARGLPRLSLDRIQQEIRAICRNIDPEFQPLVVPEKYKGKELIVIWSPGGDNRPYSAPDTRAPSQRTYYVRQGSETVRAKGEILRQLIEMTAKTPFDDRQNLEAKVIELSPILVKRYLTEVKSDLLASEPPLEDLQFYSALRIVKPVHDYLAVKNCGLLFFIENPEKYFPGARFDVVQFGDDAGGNLIEEKNFTGPLNVQVESVIDYLNSLTNLQLMKVPGKAQVERNVAFPYEALEETIVNAAYHRSYENQVEPNKVYLYPDRMEIISYPGPVAGLTAEHFMSKSPLPPVPARNRRVGEFFKELRLAEMRGTGIPKIKRTMKQNGSPDPIIEFDNSRSYFRITLPAHPKYVVVHSLRESSYLWSIGERASALSLLEKSFEQSKGSGAIAGQLIDYYLYSDNVDKAQEVFNAFHRQKLKTEGAQPYIRFFKYLISSGQNELAKRVMQMMPDDYHPDDPYEIGLAFKRLHMNERAHTIFVRIFSSYDSNPEYLHDLAQVKIAIANKNYKSRNRNWATIRRLRGEAIELLRRAINLHTETKQKAWCWYHLAKTLQFQRSSTGSVDEAFRNAIQLQPSEQLFEESYQKWKAYLSKQSLTLED